MIPRAICHRTYLFLQVGFVLRMLKHLRREIGTLVTIISPNKA